MTSKRRKNQEADNVEILIQDTSKLINPCRKVFRDFLNDTTIQIKARHENEKIFYSLEAGNGTPVVDRVTSNRFWLVPLFPTQENNLFWIGFSLVFKKRIELDKNELLGASLRFYKGLATDTNKAPIFRAEWDIPKENNNHEQPHWHVYPQEKFYLNEQPIVKDFLSLIKEDEAGSGFLKQESKRGDDNIKELKLHEFHFAMASLWHNGKNEKLILKENYLVPWLTGCLSYIKEQLIYISK